MEYLGHGLGNPFRIVEVVVRLKPAHRGAVSLVFFDQVLITTACQVGKAEKERDEAVRPNIKMGLASFKSISVDAQRLQAIFVFFLCRGQPEVVRLDHKPIHGIFQVLVNSG